MRGEGGSELGLVGAGSVRVVWVIGGVESLGERWTCSGVGLGGRSVFDRLG